MLADVGVDVPCLDFYYSTSRAEQSLGWRLDHDLGWLIEQWRSTHPLSG